MRLVSGDIDRRLRKVRDHLYQYGIDYSNSYVDFVYMSKHFSDELTKKICIGVISNDMGNLRNYININHKREEYGLQTLN